MSEIEESKQHPEVDETKRQQDEEKIRNEGGPRLNGRLAATAVGLMVGLVILLTLAVQSSGPGAQPAGRNGTDDTASNKSEVQDLIEKCAAVAAARPSLNGMPCRRPRQESGPSSSSRHR